MVGVGRREEWLSFVKQTCDPVLTAASQRRLKQWMPVEAKEDRSPFSHLEAVARTLCGIAPWLELTLDPAIASDEELQLHARYLELARQSLAAVTDPNSDDYGNFGEFGQTLVEAAFLAQALLRAPNALWSAMNERDKGHIVEALRKARGIRPAYCNWLLFSAIIEGWFSTIGEEYDMVRIDYALRQHEAWYLGDGTYSDGPEFHWDYYNSFVIHPMMLDVMKKAEEWYDDGEAWSMRIMERARRYAEVQERMIAPDGTFPVIGRSIAYRSGAFHLLAQLSYMHLLPESVAPPQARCALLAVIKRCLEAPGTFDAGGWLTIGLHGHQPSLGEAYISTGSLYLCTAAFLPLGLPASDAFWTEPDAPWTAKRVWSGEDLPADYAKA